MASEKWKPEYCRYDEGSKKIVFMKGGLSYEPCPEELRASKEGVQFGVTKGDYVLCPSSPPPDRWLHYQTCNFDKRYNGRAHCQNCKDHEAQTIAAEFKNIGTGGTGLIITVMVLIILNWLT